MAEFCGKIGCYNPRKPGQKYCSPEHAPFAHLGGSTPRPGPKPAGAQLTTMTADERAITPASHGWSEENVKDWASKRGADVEDLEKDADPGKTYDAEDLEAAEQAERDQEQAPATSGEDELITVMEAAERCGVTPTTIYLWAKAGKIERVKVGPRNVRIRASSLPATKGKIREALEETESDQAALEAEESDLEGEELLEEAAEHEEDEDASEDEADEEEGEEEDVEPVPVQQMRGRIREAAPAPEPEEEEPESEGDFETSDVGIAVARRLVALATQMRDRGSADVERELLWMAVGEVGLLEGQEA